MLNLSPWRGGFSRHAVVAVLLATVVAIPVDAQIPQQEQRISSLYGVHGLPHLSTLGNRVFSSWRGNGYATPNTGIGYSYSLDAGLTWTDEPGPPVAPPFDGVLRPTASCLAPNGITHLITDYTGVQYFKGSGALPITWQNPMIGLDVYTSSFSGYTLPSVACDTAMSFVYICDTEETFNAGASTILFRRSIDNGSSWQAPLRLSSPYCKGSSMTVGPDGTIYVAYVDYSLGQVVIQKSSDRGASFQSPAVVADILDNLGTTPIGWDMEVPPGRRYPYYNFGLPLAPNFPSLAVDRSPGPTRGNLYLTWAERAAGAPQVATTTVFDTGPNNSYGTAQSLPLNCDLSGFLPTSEFGHGESDYYVFNGTTGETVWITGSGTNGGSYCRLDMEMPNGDKVLITYIMVSTPSATTHAAPTVLTLPRTGRYFFHMDSGTENVSYQVQLRRFTLTPSPALDMRDIMFTRSTDGGATWTPRIRVNHDGPGADQGLPNVAVDGVGDVYVAWYDRRNSANGDSVEAYAAVSGDGGLTFGNDLKLSSRPSGWVGPGFLVGDRIAIAAGNDYGLVAWSDFRDWPNRADIYAVRILDPPTAIEAISDLSAEATLEGVRVAWHVNNNQGLSGLRIFRSEQGAEVALGAAEMPPTHEGTASVLDPTAEPGHRYTYRLRVRARARISWVGPAVVEVPSRIVNLAWRAAWPNPFGEQATVTLAVPKRSDGIVQVFDIQGKEVRTLAQGMFASGETQMHWDGRDKAGRVTAPGLYFISADIGGQTARVRLARVP